jgi:glycogen debranching enzyme
VASYLLDIGRSVNPDLYVYAELYLCFSYFESFTGSEEKDILFVSKLGINSLIREAMAAWDTHELSRIVHRQGGSPVGSFTASHENFPLELLDHKLNTSSFENTKGQDIIVQLKGSSPHSLFMDCTHDNETPHQRRTAEDTLPNAAIVAMTHCAIGSVKGFDEIVPELLNVVTETRKYRVPESFEGIIPAKSILYPIHVKMAEQGFDEIHVHQEHDFISIHRFHPLTHEGYLLVARTAYRENHGSQVHPPIILRNQSVQVIESATLKVNTMGLVGHSSMPYPHDHTEDGEEELKAPHSPTTLYHPFKVDDSNSSKRYRASNVLGCITGLPCALTFSNTVTNLCSVEEELLESDFCTQIKINGDTFVPGSIVLFRTWVRGSGKEGCEDVHSLGSFLPCPFIIGGSMQGLDISIPTDSKVLSTEKGFLENLYELLGLSQLQNGVDIMYRFGFDASRCHTLWFKSLDDPLWPMDLKEAISDCGFPEINAALFRSDREELDVIGNNLYVVPNYGKFSYGGLEGIVTALLPIARNNDIGHPICDNLRAGVWLLDYTVNRLQK